MCSTYFGKNVAGHNNYKRRKRRGYPTLKKKGIKQRRKKQKIQLCRKLRQSMNNYIWPEIWWTAEERSKFNFELSLFISRLISFIY